MIKQKNSIKKTYVAFVLDKSGSMESMRDATISAFNEQVQEHRKSGRKGGNVFLSLVQFSGSVEETFFNAPLENIQGELDREQYVPSGGTAMYDAIGYTLKKLERFDESGDVAFLVIVLSDGQENASRKYDARSIRTLKEELEATGRWTFQYIGCDANALKDAKINLGFKSSSFHASPQGMNNISKNLSAGTSSYYTARGMGQTSVDSFLNTNNDDKDKI